MGTFDRTILDLILAGEKAQAQAALNDGHPDAYIETTGAAVEASQLHPEADSGTSVSVGTGVKAFTLTDPRSWRAGLPVYVRSKAAPTVHWMAGKLTADESPTGDITVQVDYAAGGGTFTDWSLSAVHSIATVQTPPVAVADGGTGNTNIPNARFGLDTRFSVIEELLSAPPASPTIDKLWLVGAAPTGAWSTFTEDSYARWDGTQWLEIGSEVGDILSMKFGPAGSMQGVAVNEALPPGTERGAVTPTSRFTFIQAVGFNRSKHIATQNKAANDVLTAADMFSIVECDATAGALTLTLGNDSDSQGAEVTFVKVDSSVNTVTINAEEGGLIHGVASCVLAAQWDTVTLRARHSSPLHWYVVGRG